MNDAALRTLTPVAQKQISRELPVRVWTLATLLIALIAVGTAIHGGFTGMEERKLLAEGTKVDARVDFISGASRNADRAQTQQVSLSWKKDDSSTDREELIKVILPPSPSGGFISVGDILPIRVEPKDPQHPNINRKWTDRVNPESWLAIFATPMILTPVAIVLALLALLARKSVRTVYERGTLVPATVVETHRSAIIPGQKRVKLSVAGKRLSAAYPDTLGPIAEGDALEAIIDNPTDPKQALIARAYGLGAAQQS